MHACDGTYLVRDSSGGQGEYTLTLKKDGIDRVIKIYHKNNKYGFTKDCTFGSVVSLINFYKTTSLKEYNTILDVKLLYPVSRYSHQEEFQKYGDINKLVQKFVETEKVYSARTLEYDTLFKLYDDIMVELDNKRQAKTAYNEVVIMFNEQKRLQEFYNKKEAQPHELKNLSENAELLGSQRDSILEYKQHLERELDEEKKRFKNLEREITSLKPKIKKLQKEKERYHKYV